MLLAWMDLGDVCLFWMFILFLPSAIGGIGTWIANRREHRKAVKQAEAQEKFKRENPELWTRQELLKLEKQRVETQQQLAQEQARQENSRRNVGLVFGIGRALGLW